MTGYLLRRATWCLFPLRYGLRAEHLSGRVTSAVPFRSAKRQQQRLTTTDLPSPWHLPVPAEASSGGLRSRLQQRPSFLVDAEDEGNKDLAGPSNNARRLRRQQGKKGAGNRRVSSDRQLPSSDVTLFPPAAVGETRKQLPPLCRFVAAGGCLARAISRQEGYGGRSNLAVGSPPPFPSVRPSGSSSGRRRRTSHPCGISPFRQKLAVVVSVPDSSSGPPSSSTQKMKATKTWPDQATMPDGKKGAGNRRVSSDQQLPSSGVTLFPLAAVGETRQQLPPLYRVVAARRLSRPCNLPTRRVWRWLLAEMATSSPASDGVRQNSLQQRRSTLAVGSPPPFPSVRLSGSSSGRRRQTSHPRGISPFRQKLAVVVSIPDSSSGPPSSSTQKMKATKTWPDQATMPDGRSSGRHAEIDVILLCPVLGGRQSPYDLLA
nr:hypothetical protein Iba_chr02eCG7740 [Ipomoea batatas]